MDLRAPLVAVELLDDVILDEPVAAVNLDCGVDRAVGYLGCEQLRDARLVRVSPAQVLEVRGLVGQESRAINFRGHVRELPLNRLKLRNFLVERLPLAS